MSDVMEQTVTILNEGVEGAERFQQRDDFERNKEEDLRKVFAARQNNTIMQGTVTGIEPMKFMDKQKLAARVKIGEVKGFIPIDYMAVDDNERRLRSMAGKKVSFKIIGITEDSFMASRQAAIEHMASLTWKKISEGDIVQAIVQYVGRRHAILSVGGIDCRLEAQEFSYDWIDVMSDILTTGDAVRVKLLQVDEEKKSLKVSRKALLPDPWTNIRASFQERSEYVGTVSGVETFGNFVKLDEGIPCLTPHLRQIQVDKGDQVLVRITKINENERKISAKIVRLID